MKLSQTPKFKEETWKWKKKMLEVKGEMREES